MTSKAITYQFEELYPYWPHDISVAGEADIELEWQDAEPDVGIMRGGWAFSVEAIRINSLLENTPPMSLEGDNDMFDKIARVLHDEYSDHICDEAGDHDEGPDPDDAYDRMRDERLD